MAVDVDSVTFSIVAAVLLVMALGVVVSKKLFHAALFLAGALFLVGVVFLILGAQFLFVIQILVYVGAVATLIVFAIMFTHGSAEEEA